ncbi:MAG: glutathione peroxidase [Verrucomicrobiota bacterium]
MPLFDSPFLKLQSLLMINLAHIGFVLSMALGVVVAQSSTTPASLYDFTVNTLEGKPQALSEYRGKIALVVNLASKCGNTKQYAGLEKLWQDYKSKDFVILGFPSNDFGGQEPGTPEEIRTFCTSKYSVTFPLFEKVVTKKPTPSLIYAFLAAKHPAPEWNFHKYLIGRDGQVIQSFPAKAPADDPQLLTATEIRAAIEAALAAH